MPFLGKLLLALARAPCTCWKERRIHRLAPALLVQGKPSYSTKLGCAYSKAPFLESCNGAGMQGDWSQGRARGLVTGYR